MLPLCVLLTRTVRCAKLVECQHHYTSLAVLPAGDAAAPSVASAAADWLVLWWCRILWHICAAVTFVS